MNPATYTIHVAVAIAYFIPNRGGAFEGAGNGGGFQSREPRQGEAVRGHESNAL